MLQDYMDSLGLSKDYEATCVKLLPAVKEETNAGISKPSKARPKHSTYLAHVCSKRRHELIECYVSTTELTILTVLLSPQAGHRTIIIVAKKSNEQIMQQGIMNIQAPQNASPSGSSENSSCLMSVTLGAANDAMKLTRYVLPGQSDINTNGDGALKRRG